MFKTIHECGVELEAVTMRVRKGAPLEGGSCLCDLYDDANLLPVAAARASFQQQDKTGTNVPADLKLMKYLGDHKHMTPFEYNHATFAVEAPLFVLSQLKTHRTVKSCDISLNVLSRRYTDENIGFWMPDKFRKQSESNKQASTDEEVPTKVRLWSENQQAFYDVTPLDMYKRCLITQFAQYSDLLKAGVCREQARAVLPEALLTTFYMGATLRNWAAFLDLRDAEYAQYETRVVAQRIRAELEKIWPEAMACL